MIDAIYDAAGDADLWNTALKAIAGSMGCTASVFVGHCESNLDAPHFAHFGSLDAAYNLRRTSSECPYLPRLASLRPGDCGTQRYRGVHRCALAGDVDQLLKRILCRA